MTAPLISVENLSKRFRIDSEKVGFADMFRGAMRLFGGRAPDYPTLWALKDVSFTIAPGERIGIIGKNGAGKSTLLKILSRVSHPTEGRIRIRGRVTALLEVGTGFSDDLTGRENIYLNASLYGLSRAEIEERLEQIIDFSEIRRFVDTPIKHYSSGMRMRLAFSVAAHLDPDILILDEVLAVGDLAFQRKCLERMGELTSGGRTLLFVSHSMDAIARYCDRCIWLDAGQLRADGTVEEVTAAYLEATLNLSAKARPAAAAETPATDTTSVETTPAEIPPAEAVDGDASSTSAPPVDTALEAQPQPGADEPVPDSARWTATSTVARDADDGREVDASVGRARLLSAEARRGNGKVSSVFRADEPIVVAYDCEISRPALYVPSIGFFDSEGQVVFWSVPAAENEREFRSEPGVASFRCTIPGDLLNTGTFSISIALVGPDFAPMKRYVFAEKILSIQVIEAMGSGGARSIMPRAFPGPLRPRLNWSLSSMETLGDV